MNSQDKKSNKYITIVAGTKINLWRNNIILLLSLAILIFVAPLLDHLSTFVANTALILVVISGIFAAEFKRQVFYLLLFLGLLVILSTVISIIFPDNLALNLIPYFLVTCSLTFSTVALVGHVARAVKVDKSTVLCAINSYLLMGLTASILFLMLDYAIPESIINIQSGPGSLSYYVYYGFVTLSTLGYGDITPSAPLARSLAVFVSLGGQLYLVIVMAMIIGKFLNSQRQE
jgi:voltage-gated potassium channel